MKRKSKLSVAQRMACYMVVRDRIINSKDSDLPGVCIQLRDLSKTRVYWGGVEMREMFPEFFLFVNPELHPLHFWLNGGELVRSDKERDGIRILILQLCIEMIDKTNKHL